MQDLTDLELHTLELLARKAAGEAIPFVNIAAARALSALGLASRSHEGWDISAEGQAEMTARNDPRPWPPASDPGAST
jgi:hypothetical protein